MYFHADGQYLDLSGRMGYFVRKKDKVQSQVNTYELRYYTIFSSFEVQSF